MFDDLIAQAVAQWQIPEAWLRAVIQTESAWNPDAYNPNDPTGAYGLGQILYRTAQGLGYTGDPDGLFDPETNLFYTSKLIAQIYAKTGNDPQAFYSAYNSGSSQLYKSSGQVAGHVARFMANLESVITENPGTSSAVVILFAALIWMFFKRGA